MSSEAKVYKQYAHLAGVRVPINSTVIGSQYGSLATLNVNITYSPFITRLHENTKIQIWEQLIENGIVNEPTLEFDGIVIGIQRRKNLLGETSVSLSCLTDGAVWNIRKQADFYLTDVINVDYRGTCDFTNMRSDGQIGNFFSNILQANRFDIGCSIASILTSHIHYTSDDSRTDKEKKEQKPDVITSYYEYRFNGKKYFKKVLDEGSNEDNEANPLYYNRFLDDFRLANKVYGISTSSIIKDFFKQDDFVGLITNNQNEVYGEHTFWELALQVAQYGFFNVYDIPNPTFIKTDGVKSDVKTDVETLLSSSLPLNQDKKKDDKDDDKKIPTDVPTHQDKVTLMNGKNYNGLAEYIFKPISVMGIPFKCNVIWPDQINEESIFYDFFNTPSRVLYKRSPLPDPNMQNVLTTQMIVGPDFKSTGYLKSLTIGDREAGSLRSADVYTPYELEYGVKYFRLNLSYAFDSSLLKDLNEDNTKENTEETISKINNFLNYEFSQKFLGSRKYSISVTPDCNPVAGFPVIILNRSGEHIVAFCTGVRKTWSANGQKTVSLSVEYPKYFFEDFGDLGNIIDTISQDPIALKETCKLIGSEPLNGLTTKTTSKALKESIKTLFQNFNDQHAQSGINALKRKYKRDTCTFKQFMTLFDKSSEVKIDNQMPDSYLKDVFASSKRANELSCHKFEVYDNITGEYTEHISDSVHDIIKLHLEWTENPKRV